MIAGGLPDRSAAARGVRPALADGAPGARVQGAARRAATSPPPPRRSSPGRRRFAVRQERWFRRDPRVRWIDIEHDPVAEAGPAVDCEAGLTADTHECWGAARADEAPRVRQRLPRGVPSARRRPRRTGARGVRPTPGDRRRRAARRRVGPVGISIGADGAVQRRWRPGRDERQRHPLLRPGPGDAQGRPAPAPGRHDGAHRRRSAARRPAAHRRPAHRRWPPSRWVG